MRSYRDIAGDGGSGVVEQVGAQRARIDERLRRARHLLAVGSGKGGVGKSTLTRALARAFASRGLDVAVLDADLNGPSQARLAALGQVPLVPGPTGLLPPRDRSGIPVISLGTLVPATEAVDFETVATGDSHVWRATREFTLLGQLIGAVDWGKPDVLLVDLPPGAERTFQYAEFLGPRAAFLLVTIPSELAREVVGRSLAALGRTPNRVLGYVENMCGYRCEGCGELRPLFPAVGGPRLAVERLGGLPFDPALARADEGSAASAGAAQPAARALGALADRVLLLLETEP